MIFFLILDNGKQELPSQGAIFEIISWVFIIELIVQLDPSFVHLATLDES